MSFKTITVKESAYRKLKAAKRRGESFTELIERKFNEPEILTFAGAWSDMSDEEYREMKKRMHEFHSNFNDSAQRGKNHVMRRLGSDN